MRLRHDRLPCQPAAIASGGAWKGTIGGRAWGTASRSQRALKPDRFINASTAVAVAVEPKNIQIGSRSAGSIGASRTKR